MKKLELIPELDACDFTAEVDMELEENDICTHYESDGLRLNWDNERLPITKAWLLETYGKEVKKYRSFSIIAT